MEDPSGEQLLRELLMPRNNSSNVNFNVQAGGPALWLTSMAAIVCFLIAVGLGFLYINLQRQQERTQDHINVIYQLIPDLRKMVNEELCRQGKSTCEEKAPSAP